MKRGRTTATELFVPEQYRSGCSIQHEKRNGRQASGENSASIARCLAGTDGGLWLREVKCPADSRPCKCGARYLLSALSQQRGSATHFTRRAARTLDA